MQSMKKELLFTLSISLLLTAAKAQVATQRLHSTVTPAQNLPATTNNGSNRKPADRLNDNPRANMNNLANGMKYRPRPDAIHFMTWHAKLGMEGGANPNANRVMNYTTNKPATATGVRKASTTMQNSSVMANLMEPTITRNTPDNRKVTYKLTTDIGTWENKPNFTPKVGKASPPQSDGQWTCTTSTLSINARSTSFMNPHPDQGGSLLVPGMIYTFDDYSAGNFNQRYNANRNPVTLVSSVLNAQAPVSANVPDPNLSNLSNGIRSIISQYAPAQGGSDYQIQATLTDNNSDQDIFVSAGGSSGAFEGSASFRHKQNDHHIYYTIDAVKPMFTINVQPSANGMYNGGAPSTGSPLLMLQSVTYGARVLANMDIELKSTSDIGNLHLSYNDGMESARTDMEALFANQTVNVTINGYLIGFPTQFPGSFTATKDNFFRLMDQFFSGCNYLTCKPIQYSMVNMDGNQVGIYSATDNFNIQECSPSDETFTLQSVMAVLQSGDDSKNSNSEFWLTIGAGDANHIRWTGQLYDNHSEFKRDGNPYQVPIPLNYNGYTETDFNNGGLVALKLIEHGHSGDDWDFQDLKLIFNFVSQKGTPHVRNLDISNFKLHDTKDARQDSKQIYFQPNGPDSYAPLQ
jgi:hypothetical protein